MKKVFLFLLCAALFTSCHDTLIDDNTVQDEPTLVTNKVSYEDALKTLNEVLDVLDESRLRSGAGKRRVANYYTTASESSITRAPNLEEVPVLYVINFEDDQGFALVSGDSRTTPVLAVTNSGNLSQDVPIDDIGLISFLDGAEKSYLSQIEATTAVGTVSYNYSDWTNKYTNLGGTIMIWGQNSPYNDMAPLIDGKRALAGCVATAVAQLCAFYKYPTSYYGYSFNWNEMVEHKNDARPNVYRPSAYTQIARFFERISISSNLDMSFGLDVSNASVNNITRTLKNLGFSNCGTYTDYNTSTVLSELKKGYPVIASGAAYETVTKTSILGITINTTTSYNSGHAWLIDGLLEREREVKVYSEGRLASTSRENISLVRCNWGWNGSYNGYFYSGAFNPIAGPVLKSGESYNYQYNHKMIYNIRK